MQVHHLHQPLLHSPKLNFIEFGSAQEWSGVWSGIWTAPQLSHDGIGCKTFQSLILTFQLASSVASDRFDSLAKVNFSLARYSNIHHSRCQVKKCWPVYLAVYFEWTTDKYKVFAPLILTELPSIPLGQLIIHCVYDIYYSQCSKFCMLWLNFILWKIWNWLLIGFLWTSSADKFSPAKMAKKWLVKLNIH